MINYLWKIEVWEGEDIVDTMLENNKTHALELGKGLQEDHQDVRICLFRTDDNPFTTSFDAYAYLDNKGTVPAVMCCAMGNYYCNTPKRFL